MVQAIRWTSAIVATLGCIATSSAVDITWNGGTGDWKDAKWNAGVTAASITGFTRGDGRINDKFIVNGAGAIVNYSLDGEGGGFRPRQGVSYEIKNGALFSVNAATSGLEAFATELDLSTLKIDGGTFRRQGRTNDDGADLGGGALILGSTRSDDRIGQGVPPLGTPLIQVDLSNGGKLDNEGQMWFGSLRDHHPSLGVQVQVNGGTIDLHGGNVPPGGTDISDISADLLFTYSGSGAEEYFIDFTGPGTLIVDSPGIKIATSTQTGVQVEENISYLNLWQRGLIRSKGKSGLTVPTPDFASLFTVTGTPGTNNYTLTSKAVSGNPADLNADGGVDGADLGILFNHWGPATPNTPGNFDGSGEVDGADIAFIFNNWTGDTAPTASVPEPASFALSAAGIICAVVGRFRRRKAVPVSV